MIIQQVRNATLIITYHETRFLIDPWLLPKGAMPGFDSAVHAEVRQPRCDLPLEPEKIVAVDAVILTHWHPDHIDRIALEALRKDIPFFVQNEADRDIISQHGFTRVQIVKEEGTSFHGVKLVKTGTQHGERAIIKPICDNIGMPYDAMGIVFSAENEKKLYLAGDTIWCEEVMRTLDTYHPEIVIINACGARVATGDRLIMDIEDVKQISAYIPESLIIASHMDTVSHLTVTRADLRELNLKNLAIPEDGEVITP